MRGAPGWARAAADRRVRRHTDHRRRSPPVRGGRVSRTMGMAPQADAAPAISTPYPGPRSRAVLERLAAVEGAGLRTGGAGPAPLVVESANGSLLTDPDGNVFIDLYAS